MKRKLARNIAPLLAAASLSMLALPAAASDWFVRVGPVHVNPDSNNGTLAGGALATRIDSNTQLGLILGRYLTPNLAVELLAATPFSHTASLNGVDAVDFKHLPPTVSLQWYFLPDAKVNPFVGLGLNYTFVYDEEVIASGPLAGAKAGIDNSFGLAAQAGLEIQLNDRWDLVLDARFIDLDADVKVNGAKVGTANVDPMVFGLTLGYRF
jgi:outer membrane protein